MAFFSLKTLAFTALLFGPHTTWALSIILPNTAASAEGATTSSATGGVLGTGAFTNQFLFTSGLLSTIPVGYQIEGIQVRADGASATGSYPVTNLVWSNFDITLAEAAVSITTFGTSAGATVANNMLSPQQVRSGPLTINALSFSDTGSGPNPFGPLITFDTPYLYQGGDLILLISHSTATGTGFAVDATGTGFGYTGTSLFAQRTSTTYGATTVNTTTAAPVVQLVFNAAPVSVPEPNILALFALGGLLTTMTHYRRQRN